MADRVTQSVDEALVGSGSAFDPAHPVRTTQAVDEALVGTSGAFDPAHPVRTTQDVVEALAVGSVRGRVTQVVAEVLVPSHAEHVWVVMAN